MNPSAHSLSPDVTSAIEMPAVATDRALASASGSRSVPVVAIRFHFFHSVQALGKQRFCVIYPVVGGNHFRTGYYAMPKRNGMVFGKIVESESTYSRPLSLNVRRPSVD